MDQSLCFHFDLHSSGIPRIHQSPRSYQTFHFIMETTGNDFQTIGHEYPGDGAKNILGLDGARPRSPSAHEISLLRRKNIAWAELIRRHRDLVQEGTGFFPVHCSPQGETAQLRITGCRRAVTAAPHQT
jgi:hypothetical protein